MELDLKSKFLEFLLELEDKINRRNQNERSQGKMYNNPYKVARMCLETHEDPICDPKSLKKVPKIGDKIVKLLTDKLIDYCNSQLIDVPEPFQPLKRKNGGNDGEQVPTKKRKKAYVPRRRSGGYAIVLALYLKDKERNGLKKSEICKFAEPYSDASFESNPSNGQFYSAWNSIKVLEKNEIVSMSNRLYFLTDEGVELAQKLKLAEDIHSSPVNNRINSSFDNGVYATPEKNNVFSDDIVLIDDPRDLLSSPLAEKQVNRLDNKGIPPVKTNSPVTNSPIKTMSPMHSTPTKAHDKQAKTLNGVKYSIWPIEDVEIILVIDTREVRSKQQIDFFYNRLTNLKVNCEIRQLSVGDMCWIAKNKKSGNEIILNSICERKRIDDLLSSIYDGRFFEQKARLNKLFMKKVYYLIEQNGNDIFDSRAIKVMATAKCQMMTNGKNIVKQFDRIEDTVKFLSDITKIIETTFQETNTKFIAIKARTITNQKHYGEIMESFRNEFDYKRPHYESCHLYTSFDETMSKSQMYTVKEMFLLMLMNIKGVSLEKAITIQKIFPTPNKLLDHFKDPNNGKTSLMELTKNLNRQKKITKSLSEKIYDIWGGAT
ncbi:crossover junction endonuclease Mus81p [[Candida] jaroonii]|uniref:Crossover junction endonuclease Mus81p n=1 Tax=[Candida] jaroonii TaxID=467808 RepID=A0ACA9Y4B0_9ASCO|nr:crossover junction endonuclease Mus81p [[Candida] jaroonii]